MEEFDALEVIARTKGKVEMDNVPTGQKMFPMWGWITAVTYLLEFVLWQVSHGEWIAIPLVGLPLMYIIIRRDHERTHIRTHESRMVLDYWIFAACAFGAGGFLFGFLGVYEVAENPLICLLIGIGAFITGEVLRFRPMIVGGLAGAGLGVVSFILQGDLWIYQILCIVAVAVVSLIIPGYLFEKSLKHGI